MVDIKDVKAVGEYVVCRLNEEIVKEKKTDGGLILPASAQMEKTNKVNINGEQKPAYLTIHHIGPRVPEDCGFKIGEEVACNMYDAAKVFGEKNMFLLFNYKSIMGVVEANRITE